jgi:hypothetical protein
MTSNLIAVALAILLTGSAHFAEANEFAPVKSRERISSSHGFSFLPPQGNNWRERFNPNTITYLKQTDSRTVSFFAEAIEGRLRSAPPNKEALIALVRSKKDAWGTDGRFSNTSASFEIEAQQDSCVRYKLTANDRGAPNKAAHPHLLMQTLGRFCIHPKTKAAAVDLYYSVRYLPGFDPRDLLSEGEEFLKGLQFFK